MLPLRGLGFLDLGYYKDFAPDGAFRGYRAVQPRQRRHLCKARWQQRCGPAHGEERPFSEIQPYPRQQRPDPGQLEVIIQRIQPVVLVGEVQDGQDS